MNLLRRNFSRAFFISACFIFLSACVSIGAQPAPARNSESGSAYIFVTANPQATNTPFQPSAPGDGTLPQEYSSTTSQPTEISLNLPTETLQPTNLPLPSETPWPTNTAIPTDSAPTAAPEIIPTDTPEPPPAQPYVERPQYAITALMDYGNHTVVVSEIVLYPNRTSAALPSIVLGVNSNLWTGVFVLQTLAVNDQPSYNYSLNGQWLTINLAEPLQPGQSVKIGIGYQLNLPYSSSKFENFGYSSRQTNLIDWYPFVVPYIGGEWVLPDPYSYGENLVYEKADFRVSLTFADPANAPVVAASAPAVLENGSLIYELANARNFTISASPEYLVSSADANGVTIYNYYFGANAEAAAMVLELTRMSVISYTSAFGPYPHAILSVCETDLNDGLETDGLYFLASSFYREYGGGVRNNLATIAIHETAHQWWYGAVGNNQAVEPWLDEALATYSEHVFYEYNYPDYLTWWWNFRVYSHGATGWVDSSVYDTTSFSSYVNAVYFNGAIFLQALRDRIGDQAFYAFISDYYARNNGRISSSNDFFDVLNLHTSANISDLLDTYFNYR